MLIPNPIQIREFLDLPEESYEDCELCIRQASHLVITKNDESLNVCCKCFMLMLSVESLLKWSN
jgi:hypothetical protein